MQLWTCLLVDKGFNYLLINVNEIVTSIDIKHKFKKNKEAYNRATFKKNNSLAMNVKEPKTKNLV